MGCEEVTQKLRQKMTLFISCRNLSVISVLRGFIICPIIERMSCPPCGRAFAASKSCSVTSYQHTAKLLQYKDLPVTMMKSQLSLNSSSAWPTHSGLCILRTKIKRTTWTISFFLWTSPFGRGTYSSASKSNSVAKASLRPTRFTAPLLASMYITSPTSTYTTLHLLNILSLQELEEDPSKTRLAGD